MAKGQKTGGRRAGSLNRKTIARREALARAEANLQCKFEQQAAEQAAEAVARAASKAKVRVAQREAEKAAARAAALPPVPPEPEPRPAADWWTKDAHALLRWVYSNPDMPLEVRVDAAKSAIRYERPALVASHVHHSTAPTREVLANMSTGQLKALLADLDAGATLDGMLIDTAPLQIEEGGQRED